MTNLLLTMGILGWLGTTLLGSAPAREARPAVSADFALFSSFPPVQRRGVYATLDAETKSRLWREQIDLFLAGHPELPARAWWRLRETREALTPELFADLRWPGAPEYPRAERIVRDLESRTQDDLSPAIRTELFGRLGPGDKGRPEETGECSFLWAVACRAETAGAAVAF